MLTHNQLTTKRRTKVLKRRVRVLITEPRGKRLRSRQNNGGGWGHEDLAIIKIDVPTLGLFVNKEEPDDLSHAEDKGTQGPS